MHEFFGLKKKFGIEIEVFHKEKQIGKARFWIEGKQMWEFKVKHKLSYLITGLENLKLSEQLQGDDSFVGKTPAEILKYCLLLEKDQDNFDEEDWNHIKKYLHYGTIFFGDQFDAVTMLVYTQDDLYNFVWSTNNDYSKFTRELKNVESAKVEISIVQEVVNRFLQWYKEVF